MSHGYRCWCGGPPGQGPVVGKVMMGRIFWLGANVLLGSAHLRRAARNAWRR